MNDYEEILFTDKQEETIYSATSSDSEEKIQSELESFFEELIKRKRNDPIEGGLQASMIILPTVFAAKINEEDGMSPHINSCVNLIKYINNDHKYLTREGTRNFNIYQKENTIINNDVIELRILDGEDTLMIAITSNKKTESLFELKMLKRITTICNNLMNNNIYKNIDIGIHTHNFKIDFGEWTQEKRENIFSTLETNIKKSNH